MSTSKSIILSCAGIGSRLGIGKTKALMDICGRSLISWQLEYFKDVQDLKQIINSKSTEELQQNARSMKQVALEHYQWKTIAGQYYDFFRSGINNKG